MGASTFAAQDCLTVEGRTSLQVDLVAEHCSPGAGVKREDMAIGRWLSATDPLAELPAVNCKAVLCLGQLSAQPHCKWWSQPAGHLVVLDVPAGVPNTSSLEW